MRSHLLRTVLLSLIYYTLQPEPLEAATITVTNTNDSGSGSLRSAINTANATSGDTINFSVNGTINLASPLPNILAPMTITGTGQTITINGQNQYQVFFVEQPAISGPITISNLKIIGGKSKGGAGGNGGAGGGGGMGAGGALLVSTGASVTVDNVSFGDPTIQNSGNIALGGAGGNSVWSSTVYGGGGGGGGFRGNGGNGATGNNGPDQYGSGGGGGFGGAGGNATVSKSNPSGGGGGGGKAGAGANSTSNGSGGGGGGFSSNASNNNGGATGGGGGGGYGGKGGDQKSGSSGSSGGSGGSGSSPGANGTKGATGENGSSSGAGNGGDGGSGGAGGLGGGGGGGGGGGQDGTDVLGVSSYENGGNGGIGMMWGGGGGAGNSSGTQSDVQSNGGNGGDWGGGGGSSDGDPGIAGNGGFGGGGGGSSESTGGNGGFGGGGGGQANGGGSPGYAGGSGGGSSGFNNGGGGGGGGAGLGGAIFVQTGGSLLFSNSVFSYGGVTGSSNSASGGAAGTSNIAFDGTAGQAFGADLFIMSGAATQFTANGSNILVSSNIESDTTASSAAGVGITVLANAPTDSVTFTGTNTYTGGTTLQGAGKLIVNTDANLGTNTAAFPGPITFDGGTLDMAQDGFTTARPLSLTTNGGTLYNPNANFTATINSLINNIGPGTPGTLTIGGVGGAPGGSAQGIILANTNNVYQGGTINSGILSISADSCLGNAIGSLTLNSGSTLVIPTNANVSMQRAVSISAGTGNLWIEPGATLTINGVVSGPGQIFKSAPSGTLVFTNTANTFSGGLINNGGSIIVNSLSLPVAAVEPSVQLSGSLVFNQLFNGTYAGNIVNFSTGSGPVTKQGAGTTLVLTGTNTYSAGTFIQGGTIEIGSATNIGPGTINFNAADATLQFSAAIPALTQNITISATTTATINDGGFNSTLSGTINNATSSNTTLQKNGGGTMTLSGTNGYGATLLNAGTLSIGAQQNLGTGALTFGGNSTLFFNAAIPSFTLPLFINSGLTGTINDGGFSSTISSVIADGTGVGILQKLGAGTITLTNNNTYTGGTLIGAGTLALSGSGSLSTTGTVNISPGATFDISQITPSSYDAGQITGTGTVQIGAKEIIANVSGTFNGNVAGAGGSLTVNQGVNLTLGGINTYTGVTTVNGNGMLTLTGPNAFPTAGNLTLNTGGILDASNAAVVTLTVGDLSSDTNTANAINLGPTNLFVGGSNSTTYNGTINSTTGSLTKQGAGSLTLTGNNTYTGTTINAGTLSISVDANLGNAAGGITFTGGTLGTTATLTSARNITLSTSGTIDVAPSTITTLSGIIGPAGGSLTKQNTGTLILSGANTYAAGTTLSGGTLQANANGGVMPIQGNISTASGTILDFNTIDSGTYTYTAPTGISGSGSLVKEGPGTLILTGTTNTYTAGTTVSGGTLVGDTTSFPSTSTAAFGIQNNSAVIFNQAAGGTYSLPITGSGTLTKNGAGILTLSGSNSYAGLTTVNGGTLAISAINSFPTGGDLTLNTGGIFDATALAVNTNLTIGDLSSDATAGDAINMGGANLFVGTGNSTTFQGVISSTGGSLNKLNSGTLTLTGTNTYTGNTNLHAGILSISSDSNLGNAASNITFYGGTLETTANLTSARAIALSGSGTVQVDNLTTTLSGVISDLPGGSPGAFIKSGVGTLILTGANTYSGPTTVTGGTLQGSTTNFPNLVNGTSTITNNGAVTFNQTAPGTYYGTITGSGSLSLIGGSTLTLPGVNSYTGATSINAGTLALSGNGTLSNLTSVFINGGSFFDISGINPSTYTAGNITGTGTIQIGSKEFIVNTPSPAAFGGNINGIGGSLTKNGASSLTLSGTNNYTGLTTVNAGTLVVTTATAFPSGGNLTINGGTFDSTAITLTVGNLNGTGGMLNFGANPLTLNASGTSSFAGIINGSSTVTMAGSGTQTLSGANTYSGNTLLNSGTLSISSNGNLGTGSSVVFNGGTLLATQSFSTAKTFNFSAGGGTINVTFPRILTLTSPLTGAGSLTKTGFGALNLTANNAGYTAPITINEGLLNAPNALGSSIQVNPFGILGGVGPVGSVVNDGIVSPGNSIGTLTVNGNYTQNSSGHLLIEIGNNGASDLLLVTGSASLNGAIDVLPIANTAIFANAKLYEVVNAAGGLGGTEFSKVNVISRGGGLQVEAIYTPGIVLLEATTNSFIRQPVIKEHNPRQVGLYLESLQYYQNGQPIPSQADLISVVLDLVKLSGDQLVKALDMLHPAQFGEFGLLNNDVRSLIASVLNRHPREQCCTHLINKPRCDNSSLWIEPFGMRVVQKPRDDQRGFVSDTGGVVIGGDYCFDSGILLGLAVGGNTTYLKWSESMGNAHLPSGFASIYSDWGKDGWFLEASLLGGYDFFQTKRHIHFPGVHRNAKSKHSGWDLSAHLGGTLDFRAGMLYFEPFFNLDYTLLHENGFKEHGADSLNLNVKNKDFGFLRAEEGISFTKSYPTKRGCWSPRVWASIVTSVPLYGKNYRSSLQGQDKTFTIWVYDKTVNRFSPGMELIWSVNQSIALAARYGAEMGRDICEQKADLRFEWDF